MFKSYFLVKRRVEFRLIVKKKTQSSQWKKCPNLPEFTSTQIIFVLFTTSKKSLFYSVLDDNLPHVCF